MGEVLRNRSGSQEVTAQETIATQETAGSNVIDGRDKFAEKSAEETQTQDEAKQAQIVELQNEIKGLQYWSEQGDSKTDDRELIKQKEAELAQLQQPTPIKKPRGFGILDRLLGRKAA